MRKRSQSTCDKFRYIQLKGKKVENPFLVCNEINLTAFVTRHTNASFCESLTILFFKLKLIYFFNIKKSVKYISNGKA